MSVYQVLLTVGICLMVMGGCSTMEPDSVQPSDPVFAVYEPSRGDTLDAGLPDTIRWLHGERSGDRVRIELFNSAGFVRALADVAPNSGTFTWTLPYKTRGDTAYRVAVTSLADSAFSDTSGIFTVVNYNDGYEIDSSPSLATVIDTGGPVQAHTLTRGDVDWFRFNAVAGVTYCVAARGAADASIEVLAADSPVPLSTGGPGPDALVIWTCAAGGAYYFSITGNQGNKPEYYTVDLTSGNAVCKLLTPAEGASLAGGRTTVITWAHSANSGAMVSLYLYREDTLMQTIVSGTANNNYYSWTAPTTVPSSTRYRVKIVSDNDLSVDNYSGYFTITNVPCSITLTSPGAAFSWNTGSSYYIRWSYTGDPGPYASLALYDSAGRVMTIGSGVALAGGYFNWHVPGTLPTSATYRVKIMSVVDTLVSDFSAPFAITKIPDRLIVTAPAADTIWHTGGAYPIVWTHTGDPGDYVRLDLYDTTAYVGVIAASANMADGQATWKIPVTLPNSSGYRVKITSSADSSIAGFSDRFAITYVPSIFTITAPGAAAVWKAESTYTLNWTSSGPVGNYVSISLYQDSTPVQPVTASANNTGSYQVSLSPDLAGGHRYRIKLASVASPAAYCFSEYFTIVPVPIGVKITSPTALSTLTTGGTFLLQWTSSGPATAIVKIELFDSSTFIRTISANEYASDNGYAWPVPFTVPSGGRYRIKITNTSIDTVFSISEPFAIVNTPAVIKVTAPSAGASWNAGSVHAVGWTASANVPGSFVNISLYDDSAAMVAPVASNVARTAGSYTWPLPAGLKGGVRYRIKIASATDSSVSAFSDRFTVVPQPNSLTVTAPTASATWSAGGYYTVYWSSTGSPGSSIAIDLYDSSAFVQRISPNVYTTNGALLWLVPASLPQDTRYRIRISSVTLDTVFDFSDTFSIRNTMKSDAYEPDSVPALAKPIAKGDAAQNHVLTIGDQDWFSFTAITGATYTIETHGPTDTYLDLFSTNGTTLLASDDDSGSEGLNAKIAWTPPASGVYFFRVKGSAGAAGEYSVTVR